MMRFIILIFTLLTIIGCARAESKESQTNVIQSNHVNIDYKKSLKFKTVCLNGIRYYVSTQITRASTGFGFMAPAYESNGMYVQKCNTKIR